MLTAAPASSDGQHDEASVARALATAIDRLRIHKHRVTGARRAVIQTLARRGGHPTAAQLSADIEQLHPGVHLTTVYRTLDFLTELGIVTHVHMGHGAAAYHLSATDEVQEHLHARCRHCERVVDLPADLLDPIRSRLASEWHFELDPRHVALSGVCQTCGREATRQQAMS